MNGQGDQIARGDGFSRLMGLIAGLGIAAGVLAWVPSPHGLETLWTRAEVPVARVVKAPVPAGPGPLERYEALAQRPLFNPGRVADPQAVAVAPGAASAGGPVAGDPGQYRLVGMAGDGRTRLALVRKADGTVVTLKKGDSLDGWQVNGIDRRGVSISGGGREEILAIPGAVNGAGTR